MHTEVVCVGVLRDIFYNHLTHIKFSSIASIDGLQTNVFRKSRGTHTLISSNKKLCTHRIHLKCQISFIRAKHNITMIYLFLLYIKR